MNLFFVYYNGLRFHKGIGRVPSEVILLYPTNTPAGGRVSL